MVHDYFPVELHRKLRQYLTSGHLYCIFGFGPLDMIQIKPFEATPINTIFLKLPYKNIIWSMVSKVF